MSATKQGGRKAKAVAPEVALAMLQSAMAYCRDADLQVIQANDGDDLVLRVVRVNGRTGIDGITRYSRVNVPTTMMANAPIPTATRPEPSPSGSA